MTRCGITLFVAALLLQVPAARSAPLGKDGCAKLKVEQGELEKAGTRGSMSKGPQWAKTNLEPDKLEQIRRLLEIDEQLLFRCHGKPLVNLPQDPDPDPAAREPDAKAPAAKAAKAAKAKKDAVKKAAAQPGDQAAKGGAKTEPEAGKASPKPKVAPAKTEKKTAQKSTAAKKTKSKRKTDNPDRAPAAEPGSNPFGSQQ